MIPGTVHHAPGWVCEDLVCYPVFFQSSHGPHQRDQEFQTFNQVFPMSSPDLGNE